MARAIHSVRLCDLILMLAFLNAAAFPEEALAQSDEPIKPVPVENKLNPGKVALGERLFHDKRLSRDNSVSCASFHNLARGGVDGRTKSIGIGGAVGTINAPTVFNSSLNFRQFRDSRAGSLEEQAGVLIHDPKEMGSNWVEVLTKLSKDAALSAQFKKIYPTGLQAKNVQDALVTFERSLLTSNARFDNYLRGDKKALDADELKGYQLFKSYGCVACHQGVNVGGNTFQTSGVMADYFGKRGNITAADLGRYNVTKNEADKHVFKVLGLRNVALTAPYFHDGSAKSLNEAVDAMFRYRLGRVATPLDKVLIIKFLGPLTGEYESRPLDRIDNTAAPVS